MAAHWSAEERSSEMAGNDRGRKNQNEAPRPQNEPGGGGLGLLLVLAITAIGVGYVGYRLTLVFRLI